MSFAFPSAKHQPGDILFLPRPDSLSEGERKSLPFAESCLDHPIVLLSRHTLGKSGQASLMTSLGGQPFLDWARTHTVLRPYRLPVAPAPPHPDTELLLHLECGNKGLLKGTYVQTHETQPIPSWLLDLCTSNQQRLSHESFCVVLEHLDNAGAGPASKVEVCTDRPDVATIRARKATNDAAIATSKQKLMQQSWRSRSDPGPIASPQTTTTKAIACSWIRARDMRNASYSDEGGKNTFPVALSRTSSKPEGANTTPIFLGPSTVFNKGRTMSKRLSSAVTI